MVLTSPSSCVIFLLLFFAPKARSSAPAPVSVQIMRSEGPPTHSNGDCVCGEAIKFALCLSRENLSKDLYLMSQMDSDQFVPIWTIASMEGIKVLTTDMDLILDVLRCKRNA